MLLVMLAGCGSGLKSGGASSQGGGFYQQDGPGDFERLQGAQLADAVPRIEPLASGPNKPYTVMGKSYTPITGESPFSQRGVASWYGKQFHGRQTSSGETYDMYAMTAAHPTLPIPSYARVTNLTNGRSAIVRVNDRGPFLRGRVIDLSYAAAYKLGYLGTGSTSVKVERILPADIRAGTWQRGSDLQDTQLAKQDAAVVATAAPVPAAGAMSNFAPGSASSTGQAGDNGDPIAAFGSGAASTPERGRRASSMTVRDLPPLAAGSTTAAPTTAAAASTTLPPVRGDSGDPLPAVSQPGMYVQFGAFRAQDSAESLARHLGSELGWLSDRLALDTANGWYRLQAGPYASRGEAQAAATRVHEALGMSPVVVERR